MIASASKVIVGRRGGPGQGGHDGKTMVGSGGSIIPEVEGTGPPMIVIVGTETVTRGAGADNTYSAENAIIAERTQIVFIEEGEEDVWGEL